MILVFVGAGGSAAVDPEQYPTTLRFFEKLPEEIQKNELFVRVADFFRSNLGKETIDIEDVLATLDEFQAQHEIMNNSRSFMGWVIRGGGGLVPRTDISHLATMESSYVAPLNDAIKRQVYEFYGQPPAIEKLSDWALLLKELKKIDPTIEIFTTNYDRVLEDVTQQANIDMEYGIVHNGIDTYVDHSFWSPDKRRSLHNRSGLLTKLHGSVNWQRLNGRIATAPPRFTDDHQNHCILYPGYKGEPTEEPFRAFHDHLRNVVRGKYEPLTAAVFIGFAFRDDHINTIFTELPAETITCFITKSDGEFVDNKPPPDAPRTNQCIHFRGGLMDRTVSGCLNLLSRRKP